jgi:hypothetical protein
MARQINRLTTRLVAALVERAGRGQLRPEDYRRHADGGNPYLVVKENGGIGWSFIYRWHGKPVEIGLGSARDVSLGSAQQKAAPMREQLARELMASLPVPFRRGGAKVARKTAGLRLS